MQLDPGGRPYPGSSAESPFAPRPRREEADEGPPILDPFVRSAPSSGPPAPDAPPSAFATASLAAGLTAFILGPLAGVPALVFGVLGRREARDPRVGGGRRATVGLVIGLVASLLWSAGAVAAWLVWRSTSRAEAAVGSSPDAPGISIPGPGEPRALERDRQTGPEGTVPRVTTEKQLGAITLVELGHSESSLASALVEQAAAASTAGQKLLVTTASSDCEPCDGFVASLPDPLMQGALEKVRVIRVSIEVFGDEMDGLRLAHDVQPGFFLLDFDLAPRDAIHGGEWGLDIAPNIAPVLGPFVRGTLKQRKHHWPLPPAPRRNSSDPRRGGGIWL